RPPDRSAPGTARDAHPAIPGTRCRLGHSAAVPARWRVTRHRPVQGWLHARLRSGSAPATHPALRGTLAARSAHTRLHAAHARPEHATHLHAICRPGTAAATDPRWPTTVWQDR